MYRTPADLKRQKEEERREVSLNNRYRAELYKKVNPLPIFHKTITNESINCDLMAVKKKKFINQSDLISVQERKRINVIRHLNQKITTCFTFFCFFVNQYILKFVDNNNKQIKDDQLKRQLHLT